MIDNLSLGLTHGLMLLAAWLLMKRPDLDAEGAKSRHWRTKAAPRPPSAVAPDRNDA